VNEKDPGVPGALPMALLHLEEHVPAPRIDRLWIFPPLARGRRESGLIAASCYAELDRRLLVTLAYLAEETGKGITFTPVLQEEGDAPEDRIPRVIAGVVRRSGGSPGEPRCVRIGGDPEALRAWVETDLPAMTRPPTAIGDRNPEFE